MRRGNDGVRVFEIVSRDARPHPEERARASASAKSNERARVSKDEDGHGASPSCFETHRSALWLWKRLRSSGCDAPQHEGEGAPRIVGRTKPSEHQPAAARKHRRPRSVVSGCYLQWLAQLQRVEPSARGPVGGQRGHGEMGALTPLHARAARRARCDDPRSPPVCRNRARPAAECRESRPPCSRW
jgi:hypothetical protein